MSKANNKPVQHQNPRHAGGGHKPYQPMPTPPNASDKVHHEGNGVPGFDRPCPDPRHATHKRGT